MSTFAEIKQIYFDKKKEHEKEGDITHKKYCDNVVNNFVTTFKQNAADGINGAVYYEANTPDKCHKEIYERFNRDDLKGVVITSQEVDDYDGPGYCTRVSIE